MLDAIKRVCNKLKTSAKVAPLEQGKLAKLECLELIVHKSFWGYFYGVLDRLP